MFEGGYRNREKIFTPNKGYGVVIMPESVYKYPKNHPCHGCVFLFQINKPSCMSGSSPDTENCVNALYKKILARQRAEYEQRLKQSESEKGRE
jgi:hypothetical protein